MIRNATKSDALGIAETQVESWKKTYLGQVPDEYLSQLSVPKRFKKWQEHFSSGVGAAFVAEHNDIVVGFANFGPSRDADKDPKIAGELYAIYLRPGTERRGLGRALFDRGIDWLRKETFSEMTTWVLATNVKAIRFYERIGMTRDGFKKPDNIGGRDVIEVRYFEKLG